jgi:ribosomal protein S18 acetylase RimI-like enzyme
LGIGKSLLVACEKALNTSRLRLSLRPSNLGALALYRGQGYVEVDRWRRYYRNSEDALVMEKHNEQGSRR